MKTEKSDMEILFEIESEMYKRNLKDVEFFKRRLKNLKILLERRKKNLAVFGIKVEIPTTDKLKPQKVSISVKKKK